MYLRYFVPIYLCVYLFAAFVWRSYRVWRKTGVNPVTFRGSDSAHDFIGRVSTFIFVLIALAVFLYSVFPAAYRYALPIWWLEHRWVRWTGVVLLTLSLEWIVVAQRQMGSSWRIGIDTEHRAPLVRRGVFNISRNPIFLGMMMTLVGLFLTIPNVLTLLALVVGVILIGIQVRLEEEFLARAHSTDYAEYRSRVRRWI